MHNRRMTRAVARAWGPIVVVAFVACVWINQGGEASELRAIQQPAFASPVAYLVDAIRYPFALLYHRASDVKLYYELSSMMLGRPADSEFVQEKRGQLPPAFVLSSPPADGKWHIPYVEVPLEYPAMALPFLLGPRLLVSNYRDFGLAFGALMGLCLVGAIIASLDAARAAGVEARGLRARAWLASGLLVAHGAIAVQRLDAVTALWIALAVRAAVYRKPLAFGAWAGLATATKLVPVLMLPALLAADAGAWRSPRRIAQFSLGFTVALAAGLGPMFAFSPRALASVVAYHAQRGLQCESTLGLVLATFRLVTGTRAPSTLSFGSHNIDGPAADALAALCGPLAVVAMLGLGCLAWRGATRAQRAAESRPDQQGRVACAAMAALIVLWLTGKVFSPQFMTWGLPIVLAVPGSFGIWLGDLLLAAMALTQVRPYGLLVEGRALGLLVVGARQVILAIAGYMATRSIAGRAHAQKASTLLNPTPAHSATRPLP
ncbi:MAG: DUF2029 domain-containing protein [Myxococcota bacterium]|nr:DUF2029 domain-containing protein [Myxococcota bacterium]